MEHSIKETPTTLSKVSCSQSNRCLLSAMIQEEVEMRKNNDHATLSRTASQCSPNVIWREKVTQWCYDVVDHLNESRDLVFVSMNILDRYFALHHQHGTNERDYEAAALTALFLAVRISGGMSLEAVDLVRMSRLGICIKEIVQVGKAMTTRLSWSSRILTPTDFCNAFVSLLPTLPDESSYQSIIDTCRYLSEISVCDIYFSGMTASKVALSVFCNALFAGGISGLSREQKVTLFAQIKDLTGLSTHDVDIISIRDRLHGIYRESQDNAQGGPHLIPDSDDEAVCSVSVRPLVSTRVVSCEQLNTRPLPRSTKSVTLSSSSTSLGRNLNMKRYLSHREIDHASKRLRSESM